MIFLYILLAVVAVVLLILFSSIRIKIEFSQNLKLKFYLGFIKIPEKLLKKQKKASKKSKKTAKKTEKKAKIEQKKPKKSKLFENIKQKGYYNSLIEVMDFLKPILAVLESFAAKIRINPLIIKIKMTGSDAADLAIDYGKFCTVYYPLIELIESKTNCKNINSDVFVDYVSNKPEIYIKTELKIRLVHILTHGFKIIMEFISFKEKFN